MSIPVIPCILQQSILQYYYNSSIQPVWCDITGWMSSISYSTLLPSALCWIGAIGTLQLSKCAINQ